MLLTPAEQDRLLLFTAAQLARARLARGLKLNVPETIAIVADTVCEAARDGARHAEALAAGESALTPGDVLPGVATVVREVVVEAVFEDGTRLVVVPDPVGGPVTEDLPGEPGSVRPEPGAARPEPGALLPVAGGPGAGHADPPDLVDLDVVNTAAVPISVTSHFHFFEANPRLRFDRAAAYGRHLVVEAGAAVRFDPGEPVRVTLAPFGGERVVIGFSGLVDGPLDAPGMRAAALERARALGFLGASAEEDAGEPGASGPVGRP